MSGNLAALGLHYVGLLHLVGQLAHYSNYYTKPSSQPPPSYLNTTNHPIIQSTLEIATAWYVLQQFLQNIMRVKGEPKTPITIPVTIPSESSITDFQYNHNGSQLAVADSDGIVYIFHRNNDRLEYACQFKGDDAAIWKICWADPSCGEVVALGSFKRKVAVFQNRGNNAWTEIAYHELHEGSVNHVEWASSAFGVKLFSAGSDGSIVILELKKGAWVQEKFAAYECSINSLSLRPLALNEDQDDWAHSYPMLATVGKDNVVKVWQHTSELSEQQLTQNARIYQQMASFKPHNEAIRSLLWKKQWTESEPIDYQLFTSSEDGTVKLSTFRDHKLEISTKICQYEHPIFRISQSITGNLLSVSVANQTEQTFVYAQSEDQLNWGLVNEAE